MAEEALEDGFEEGGEPSTKKVSGKRLIIAAVILLVLIGGGVGAALVLLGGEEHPPAEVVEGEAPPPQPVDTLAYFFEVPDMIVNLNTNGRKSTFLKIKIALELQSAGDADRIDEVLPRIVDNFQIYLRELRVDDLDGSAGMYRLREELLRRVNLAARPVQVEDVLFKEMLVQ